jgi:hypothetical protein
MSPTMKLTLPASGETALRWTAAGMLEAEQQFRKVIGPHRPGQAPHRDRPSLTRPAAPTTTTTEKATVAAV